MDLQVPFLAVLSAENATLNDQLQWLYDFPFAALIRRPIFQTALNNILKSLTSNQLLEYMDDCPYNPAMTDRIVRDVSAIFSGHLGTNLQEFPCRSSVCQSHGFCDT